MKEHLVHTAEIDPTSLWSRLCCRHLRSAWFDGSMSPTSPKPSLLVTLQSPVCLLRRQPAGTPQPLFQCPSTHNGTCARLILYLRFMFWRVPATRFRALTSLGRSGETRESNLTTQRNSSCFRTVQFVWSAQRALSCT